MVSGGVPTANFCSIYVFMGTNVTESLIASEELFNADEWTAISGSYQPKTSADTFNIRCRCTLSGASHTEHFHLDDVTLGSLDACEEEAPESK